MTRGQPREPDDAGRHGPDEAGRCKAPEVAGRTDGPESPETANRRVIRYERTAADNPSTFSEALQRIAAGEASVLVVERLRDAGESLRALLGVIDWLESVGAELVAEDVGMDTASAQGRYAVSVLREIATWERDRSAGRPARGRPGLHRHAPELTQRIEAMREDGMTMRAIADALNAEGVPTPRGGARWRPSSVQSALGYRRPPPPVPGLPPRPPAPPGAAGPRPAPPRPGPIAPKSPPPPTPGRRP